MSTRALRKLQGGQRDLDLPNDCQEEEEEEEEDEDVETEETQVMSSKGQNRFDLLIQGSPSESEVKEDDDLTEAGEGRDDVQRGGASPQPPFGSGAKRKRKKKKRRGKAKIPASSEDPTDNDKDEIDNIIEEVNAISGESRVQVTIEKPNDKVPRNLLMVEHRHLNPQNEMKRIFGSRVVQANENNRRRGRTGRSTRSTWIVQGHPNWDHDFRQGISMVVAESTQDYQVFKYVHSQAFQQTQFKFLEAVESQNTRNIVTLLDQDPFHVDTLLQISEIFRLGDDSAVAARLIERALYVLESASHPLFNIATGACRLHYRQQENRSLFVALFRHILNVGQKGCYRTALELCKLLLNLSPDEDPLAVSLMMDFYALRAQEYAWLVALYDQYEPSKNLSLLPSFSYSVPLALFHLSVGVDQPVWRDKRDSSKAAALAEELGTAEEMRQRADQMIQRALIMFPGVLISLLDKCNIQPDPVVTSHPFFGPTALLNQNKGLSQIVNLYVGRCYHVWKEAGVVSWLEENVHVVLARIDSGDPLVKEGEEMRKVRYQGTPLAIYRHILMSEIKDATVTLPPAIANTPIMSYDPLPPPDSVCGYSRPTPPGQQTPNSSSILASFFHSLLPNYDPNSSEGARAEEGAAAAEGEPGADEVLREVGDLRASVNTLLDAMRDLLSNIHLPEPPGNDADMSEEENNEWD